MKFARKKYKIEAMKNGYYRLIPDSEDDDESKSPTSLRDEELLALFAIKHILSGMTSDLLRELFAPLQKRFINLLDTLSGKLPEPLKRNITICKKALSVAMNLTRQLTMYAKESELNVATYQITGIIKESAELALKGMFIKFTIQSDTSVAGKC